MDNQNNASLLSAPALFGQAWAIYKQKFGTFTGVMIFPVLVMIGYNLLLTSATTAGNSTYSSFFSKFAGLGIILIIVFTVLLILLMIISQLWGQVTLLYAIKDNQEEISVKELYKKSWGKMLPYFWVAILAGAITMGGFFLLIIPGIIFGVWFGLAIFVFVAEDLKGMNALMKSKEYVRGKWGSVFWRTFFIGILVFIISLVLSLGLGFLKVPYVAQIGQFVSSLFLTPLVFIYTFLLYSNLKSVRGDVVVPVANKKGVFIFIGILGILVIPAIFVLTVLFSFNGAKVKANDAMRQAELNQLRVGIEMYYNDHNAYPASLNELSPKYLPSVPTDPITLAPFQYQLEKNATDYQLCAPKTEKCVSALSN